MISFVAKVFMHMHTNEENGITKGDIVL